MASPGWVGMALSFRGNIVGSDVVIGWVSDAGEATLVVSEETSQKNASLFFLTKIFWTMSCIFQLISIFPSYVFYISRQSMFPTIFRYFDK